MEIVGPLTEAEVTTALKVARDLVDAGVPIFSAPPNSSRPGQYILPNGWEQTSPRLPDGSPNYRGIDRWRPGWALGSVGGWAADFLDEDPRSGGRESMRELEIQGQVPRSFGEAETPSGGRHLVISPTGERKSTGFMPGLDLQSGAAKPDEHGKSGRGFIYISPTVRPSKAPETIGQLRPYRWTRVPDLEQMEEWRGAQDDSLEGIVSRVYAYRDRSGRVSGQPVAASSAGWATSQLFGSMGSSVRSFTVGQAIEFCKPALERLGAAQVGDIEDACNDAAAMLYHFVPSHLSVDEGMAALRRGLSRTAYDENHPASQWTVEKFRDVLTGARPPADAWKAARAEESLQVAPSGVVPDAVAVGGEMTRKEWLRSQLVSADDLADLPAPVPLIYGVLDMDSQAWLVGLPGSFKSFIALDMAAHVGSGKPWQGNRVRKTRVLYVAAEGGGGMTLRTRAWRKMFGPMPGVDFLALPIQAAHAQDWAAMTEMAVEGGYGFIVLDTQARMTVGLDENSAKDAGVFIAAMGAVKTLTGACVLAVHHTTKDGRDIRGSGSMTGAAETELRLTRAEPRSSMQVLMRDKKQKDMAESETGLALKMAAVDLGKDPETDRELSSLVLLAQDQWQQAEASVEEDGREIHIPDPVEWMANLAGHRARNVQRILAVMHAAVGDLGETEAKIRDVVLERWFGGARLGDKRSKSLRAADWVAAWSAARDLTSARGEPVLVCPGGSRWALNGAVIPDEGSMNVMDR